MNQESTNSELGSKTVHAAVSDLPKTIPKYCTSIQVGVLENENLVLTLLYAEGGKHPQAVLIDRIIIDKKHAAELAKILQEVSAHDKPI